MFKALKDNKIIAINETGDFPCLVHDSVEEDKEHSVDDYEQYQGEYLLKSDIPAPTQEEQKEKRAQAYLTEVDPITSHIQRLRDDEEPDEQRIDELIAERLEKVEEIQARYPYPEDIESIIASGD